MGGQGSGRLPSEATIIARQTADFAPITDNAGFILPNYSGVKDAALKSSSVSFLQTGDNVSALVNDAGYITSAGAESDPVFMALSGSLPYLPIALSGSLPYLLASLSGSLAYIPLSLSGSLNYVKTETDPVFMALSGSLAYIPLSLSGSLPYIPMALSGSLPYLLNSLSGSLSYIPLSLSGSLPYVLTSLSGSLAYLSDSGDTCSGTLSGSKFVTTSDWTTSGSEVMRNIVLGTDATPPTASNFTQGTLYVQYTP